MSYHVLYCRTWEMSSIDQDLWHGSRPSWPLGVYMYVVLSLQWRNVKIFKKPILAHYKWETRGRMQPRGIRIVYEMNFTFCVLLVYNDNGSVQTLCITRVSAWCKVFAQTHCHYKPTIHKAWNSFYIFTLFSCVWILFYQSLSWKWLCFSWKSNGMHSKWKSLEKIVLCDSNLVIIDTKQKSIFHRVL